MAAFFALACSSDTTDPGPGPEPIRITYSPQTTSIPVLAGETREFTATVNGTDIVEVQWTLDGTDVATGESYLFEAATVGNYDLVVAVDADGTPGSRSWELTVSPDESTLPPVVSGLAADHGDTPGEVVVSWIKNTTGTHPLDAYLVAVSYTDRITEAEWDEADFVTEVAPGPAIGQELAMSEPEFDIRPGESAWFAVRVRDDHGQLSHLDSSVNLEVSTAWHLELVVRDDEGTGMATTLVTYDCGDCVEGTRNGVTGGNGSLRVGPFRSVDAVTVATNTSDDEGGTPPTGWFDYTSGPLPAGTPPLEIVLPRRYALDLEPCVDTQHDNFMDYLQFMTKTALANPADSERRLLHRWRDYPVAVYLYPETLPALGEDVRPHLRNALAAWSGALGEGWLIETADSNSADIIVDLGELHSLWRGLMVVEPGAPPAGTVEPERVRVLINRNFPFPTMVGVSEVAMHEIGHALGLLNHSCGSGKGNLMDNGGLSVTDLEALDPADWYTLIHATETRAVNTIRHLPASVGMAAYDTE